MNYNEKKALVAQANDRRSGISDAKGPEYAGQADNYTDSEVDVLANFKRQDDRWGFDSEGLTSAFVYFGKHIDSIETFGRELSKIMSMPVTDPDYYERAMSLVTKGEGIISRLDDARNYLDLIECLLADAGMHPTFLYPDIGYPEDDYALRGDLYFGGLPDPAPGDCCDCEWCRQTALDNAGFSADGKDLF